MCLTLLGINRVSEIKDYQIFKSDDSIEIDSDKLTNLLGHINLSDTYTEQNELDYLLKRLSYRKSIELAKIANCSTLHLGDTNKKKSICFVIWFDNLNIIRC